MEGLPRPAAPYHHGDECTHIALVHDEVAQAMQRRCLFWHSQPGAHYGVGAGVTQEAPTSTGKSPSPTPDFALNVARVLEQQPSRRRELLESQNLVGPEGRKGRLLTDTAPNCHVTLGSPHPSPGLGFQGSEGIG